MSYDLYFWRETRKQRRKPEATCKLLCEEEQELAGIELLSVAAIKACFQEFFPEISDNGHELDWEGAGSYFQVTWPVCSQPGVTTAFCVTCGYQLLDSPDTMNRIIDVGTHLGCALYDPQVNQRFDQPEPRGGASK